MRRSPGDGNNSYSHMLATHAHAKDLAPHYQRLELAVEEHRWGDSEAQLDLYHGR